MILFRLMMFGFYSPNSNKKSKISTRNSFDSDCLAVSRSIKLNFQICCKKNYFKMTLPICFICTENLLQTFFFVYSSSLSYLLYETRYVATADKTALSFFLIILFAFKANFVFLYFQFLFENGQNVDLSTVK